MTGTGNQCVNAGVESRWSRDVKEETSLRCKVKSQNTTRVIDCVDLPPRWMTMDVSDQWTCQVGNVSKINGRKSEHEEGEDGGGWRRRRGERRIGEDDLL